MNSGLIYSHKYDSYFLSGNFETKEKAEKLSKKLVNDLLTKYTHCGIIELESDVYLKFTVD